MTNTHFVNEAMQKVGSPEILVNVISRRVRLLGQGARPMVEVHPRWTLMEIALKEISDGVLSYEFVDAEDKDETAAKKKRKK